MFKLSSKWTTKSCISMSACCHAAALLSSVTLGVDVELTLEAPPLAFAAQGYCSSGCLGRKNLKPHLHCDVDRSWAGLGGETEPAVALDYAVSLSNWELSLLEPSHGRTKSLGHKGSRYLMHSWRSKWDSSLLGCGPSQNGFQWPELAFASRPFTAAGHFLLDFWPGC